MSAPQDLSVAHLAPIPTEPFHRRTGAKPDATVYRAIDAGKAQVIDSASHTRLT